LRECAIDRAACLVGGRLQGPARGVGQAILAARAAMASPAMSRPYRSRPSGRTAHERPTGEAFVWTRGKPRRKRPSDSSVGAARTAASTSGVWIHVVLNGATNARAA
jgi:hypothetical protein